MVDDGTFDKYEQAAEQFETRNTDRMARRGRNARSSRKPVKVESKTIADLTDLDEARFLPSSFRSTYQPSRHEARWLGESLNGFYDRALITDVLAQVKGGKEASVYRCAGHPSTGLELIAAKVYRPRMFRSLSNDALYKEGRPVIDAAGRAFKKTDHREMRALGKKTAYGLQLAHTSWLAYEFTTLQRLHRAGAAVPKPVASGENAILMGYQGDANLAAPTLIEIGLDFDEAHELFDEVVRNIEIMLSLGLVHGDLSAYNILYWEGEITLIDFPQVVSVEGNRQAYAIFRRDVTRVCEYFARQGVEHDAEALAWLLWSSARAAWQFDLSSKDDLLGDDFGE